MLKICFPSRREAQKRGSSNPQIHQNSMKNRCKKLEVFQIALGIDFWSILDGFLLQVGRQNRVKIDIKWCWKNDEKMMMAWMALRWHLGAHDGDRPLDSRAQGGGGRRAKPLLQGRRWGWLIDWMLGWGFHEGSRPLQPEAGGIYIHRWIDRWLDR